MRTVEKRLSIPVTAVLLAAAVGLLVILGGRSAQADPGGPVPNPGHPWDELQDHGIDGVTGDYWLGTTDSQALELHVNAERALRLEPHGTSPNVIGGHSDNNAGGAYGVTIGGGGSSGSPNAASGDFATIGGGDSNTTNQPYATVGGGFNNDAGADNATVGGGANNTASDLYASTGGGDSNWASADYSTVGGGYSNAASGPTSSTVGGGYDNTASGANATVGGGQSNIADSDRSTVSGGGSNQATAARATVGGGGNNIAGGQESTIGGGSGNTAGATNATVGGGYLNAASSNSATVGGGYDNTATALASTVGGGRGNEAAAAYATIAGGGESIPGNTATRNRVTDDYGAIGGGGNNRAGRWATVGGGGGNTASGDIATIGGGGNNMAIGQYSTIPGGNQNFAQGSSSFAAGTWARANNDGCFVWGDSSTTAVNCNTNDRFMVQAGGGVYLYTNSTLTSGSRLLAGGNSWGSLSDRNVKENFSAVDGQEVVAALADISMATWNYTTEDTSIRHMGPTAQDLYSAFGLGDDERYITTIDADGVALAAIQGLYELSQEQEARIDTLEARVTALETGAPLVREAPAEAGSDSLLSSVMPGGWLLLAGLFVLGGLVVVQRRLRGVGR